MLDTIASLNKYAEDVGVTEPSLMNFCVTDGSNIVVTRYISSRKDEAASLVWFLALMTFDFVLMLQLQWFSSGTEFNEYAEGGHYRMTKSDKRENIIMIASEPLTFERGKRQIVLCHKLTWIGTSRLDGNKDKSHGGCYSQDESTTNSDYWQVLCPSIRSCIAYPRHWICRGERSIESSSKQTRSWFHQSSQVRGKLDAWLTRYLVLLPFFNVFCFVMWLTMYSYQNNWYLFVPYFRAKSNPCTPRHKWSVTKVGLSKQY